MYVCSGMIKLTAKGLDLKQVIKELEIRLITEALSLSNQSRTKASRLLGIGRTSLVEKMRKYGMPLNYYYFKKGLK